MEKISVYRIKNILNGNALILSANCMTMLKQRESLYCFFSEN